MSKEISLVPPNSGFLCEINQVKLRNDSHLFFRAEVSNINVREYLSV